MPPTDVRLGFLVMVPVGHHVTLRYVERAIWADDGSIEGWVRLDQPLVRHDETGIVFCLPQLVPWVDPRDLSLLPPGGGHRSTLQLHHGRVAACIVGNRPGDDIGAMQTRLVLEADAPAGAYR